MKIEKLTGTESRLYELVAPLVMSPNVLRQNNNYPFKTSRNHVWFIACDERWVYGFVPVELRTQQAIINNYYVRGTFTHNNLDFANDVLHLADEGFEQISVEPVVAQPTDDYAIRQEDVPFICEQYDLLAKELVKRKKAGNGFNFFHFMIDLNGGPCVAKRLSGCGSGCEYLAVTPWGDFYPCHQFVGNEDFLMGNVDDGITRTDIRDMFKNSNVYSKEKCKNCFAKFYCSGGCAANSYNFHGNINDAYDIGCDLQRKRIECAIMIKAALAND